MKLVHVRRDMNHMATTFRFRLSCPEARAREADLALARAHSLVSRLETELSEFLPESPVARLNRAAPLERVALTPAALELLALCARLRQLSRGAFDPTAKSAPLAGENPAERVDFDASQGVAWRLDAGARLGFGAVGKGYALDQARASLERDGFTDYLLDAGGSSIVFSGLAGPGEPWTWAWNASDARFSHRTGEPVAIGVSGTEEKGEHLLDPRRPGAAARDGGLKSALVAHPSAAQADALSTALYVSGWQDASSWMRDLVSPPAIASVDREGVTRWNGLFHRLWGAASATCLALALSFSLSLSTARADEPAPTSSEEAPADPSVAGDGAVDLGDMGLDAFAPYVVERNSAFIALPLLALGLVALHLRKNTARRVLKPVLDPSLPPPFKAPLAPKLTSPNASTQEKK